MEPSTMNDFATITKGRWQWRSNPDPWSQIEETKWEPYSVEHNYLIEKAYYGQQKEVDLGDYLVYPLDLLQRKKGNLKAQRPIRRVNWIDDEEVSDRSARYFETELPKTINKIFGSLGDFVSFFSRRNPGISEFASQFEEFEQSNDLNILNKKIIPKLVDCFGEILLKPNEEQLQDSLLTQFKKNLLLKIKGRIEKLICMFLPEFSSLKEFYSKILKAYTMDTDLYPSINRGLRNESWSEVDKLLPYVFCLCKAFFHFKLEANLTQNDTIEEVKPLSSKTLYRGAAFDEFTLSFYDLKTIQHFSWNSVTSTSTSKKTAEDFMYQNTDIMKKKYPVLFLIEVPLTTGYETEYLKWIDIHEYSAIPKEDEVVLAPGSVFELIEVSTDQDKKTIINLKLRNEIKSLAHGGMMMQGALQSQMMTEREAKILCLEGEELHQAFVSISGNKLIEEVEFCLCTFNKKSLSQMFEVLPTLEKVTKLKYTSCKYQNDGETTIEGRQEGGKCEIKKIEVIESNDFFQIICNERHNPEYWGSLKELDLDFRSNRSLTDEELNCAVSQGFKYPPQLTHLSLNLERCEGITDNGVHIFSKELNSLTRLTNLDLNFSWCKQITDEGMNILTQKLNYLTRLTNLDLDFSWCNQITDEGANGLVKCLTSLTQLTHFNLRFDWGKLIKNKGTSFLTKLLSSHTQLTHLNLDFTMCLEITKETMNSLATGLDSLTKLTHLNLNFYNCIQNTDEAVRSFAQGLDSLTKLTHLNIGFGNNWHITDDGVNNLAQKFNSLTQLAHLSLDFQVCSSMTDNGVINLAKGLNSINQLTYFKLEFRGCREITKEGVRTLMSQGLKNLTQLTSLILDFDYCDQIRGEDLQILAEKWLHHLISLKSPFVKYKRLQTIDTPLPKKNYKNSRVILVREKFHPEKGPFSEEVSPLQMAPKVSESPEQSEKLLIEDLIETLVSPFREKEDKIDDAASALKVSEMIPRILHLNSLTLNFKKYKFIIANEFVHKLSSQVLSNLPQLRSLTLSFRDCEQITDEGVGDLASYGLKPLTNLASLKLDFYWCGITDKGVADLAWEGLGHLSQLKSFALNFRECRKVTNKGLISLAWHGLRHLSQLESLVLSPSASITDVGIDGLVSGGLQYLTQLKFFSLDFVYTHVTDKAVNNLVLGIAKNLPQLTLVDLNLSHCKNVSNSTRRNIIKVLHYFGFKKEVDIRTLIDWGYILNA